MAEKCTQRRLAAILAADVVGYSRLMEQDEVGTLAALRSRRHDVLMPMVNQHHGRVVKIMGDGVLVEFGSAVDAVQCAVELQKGFTEANQGEAEAQRIILRIGINLGDVIVEGSDIYGEGVNIAARLEAVAEPGGICFSGKVHDEVHGKVTLEFEDMGECQLKNIDRPVQVYRVRVRGGILLRSGPPLPDKPSIAVLPFINLSNDPAREFFADGMTEDIITALSRIGELFVISRSSSFVYKGRNNRIETIARELGVRYVLEGSVRAAGDKVRVTAQLIDGVSGNHVWAERYDRDAADIFAVQDEITRNIALALQIKLARGETARLWDGQTGDLRAWEKMAQARELHLRFTVTDNAQARRLLEEALVIDPNYTGALVFLGLSHWWVARFVRSADKDHCLRLAEDNADRALAIDPGMGAARMLKGGVAHLRHRHDEAVVLCQRAIELSPSDSWVMAWYGFICVYAGEAGKALASLKAAMRLSPHYPAWYTYYVALAHLWLGDFAAAIEAIEIYRRGEPDDPLGVIVLATIHSFAGRKEQAREAIRVVRERFSQIAIADLALSQCYRDPAQLERVLGAMREAGLPE